MPDNVPTPVAKPQVKPPEPQKPVEKPQRRRPQDQPKTAETADRQEEGGQGAGNGEIGLIDEGSDFNADEIAALLNKTDA